jgi:MYXO-CTERM domain-containing protein
MAIPRLTRHGFASALALAPLSAALLAAVARDARAAERVLLTPSPAAHYPAGTHYRPLCPGPDAQGRRCFAQVLVDADDYPITDTTSPPGGWTPGELETAYGLPTGGGKGTTIAIYIGSHYTNAESDAAAYRTKFGLPPCTSAGGCFTQVTDHDTTDFSGLSDDGCSGMMGEESLDVHMAMAGCPACNILVIEGSDSPSAWKTAVAHHAVSISMSWGYTPESQSDCDSNFIPPAGLTLFGASGDSGYTATPGEPGSCTNVVAVGWTQLATASSARGYADTIPKDWGSAGGCDKAMKKGAWQKDTGCSARMISDLSANGDNVANYCTSPSGSSNWGVTGGSSASSPFVSGALAALGVTGPGKTFDPQWVYDHASEFWDVTSGGPVSNCPSGSPAYFCTPAKGYDGPTGVGTPYGPMLLPEGGAGAEDGGSSGADGGKSGGGDAGTTGHADAGADATAPGGHADAGLHPDASALADASSGNGGDGSNGGNGASAGSGNSAGCSCDAAGGTHATPWAAVGGAFVALLALRRRKGRQPDGSRTHRTALGKLFASWGVASPR